MPRSRRGTRPAASVQRVPARVRSTCRASRSSEAAAALGVTAQAIYLRVSRGQLRAETVTLDDGRSYKRVFPDEPVEGDGKTL